MWPFKDKKSEPPARKTRHHYEFAHVALKQVCLGDPLGFFAMMASPQRQAMLDDLWAQICRNCDHEGEARFSPSDINISTTRIGEYPVLTLEMPTPHQVGEAHMICIVLKVPFAAMQQKPEKPEVRYFTLEKGVVMESGGDRTVLCEWRGESHANYGDGPEPTPPAFMQAVEKLL